jgi:heme d1 biosynthesis radical SAM protein NirJ
VIWNLIRRCNLACEHCYSNSVDQDFPGELSTEEVFRVMDDLKTYGVPALVLSGGEPLMRADVFTIARRAKSMGFFVALSSNGTRINEDNIEEIAAVGFDYVGISLDGLGPTHDRFRRHSGAFTAALQGVRRCVLRGIKIGLRFTPTRDNVHELPDLLQVMDEEGVTRFYLSHLNYGGRGNRNRRADLPFETVRWSMDRLFERAWHAVANGEGKEFVTGNNDADGVYLLHWVQRRLPERYGHAYELLRQWGGNSSGVNVGNIDNLGNVHPDTFWWHYTLGNVRERPFSELWEDRSDPLLAGLKSRPRPVRGRCGECAFLAICNGNTRVRATQLTGDPWAEDPGCYLTDAEIGRPDHG